MTRFADWRFLNDVITLKPSEQTSNSLHQGTWSTEVEVLRHPSRGQSLYDYPNVSKSTALEPSPERCVAKKPMKRRKTFGFIAGFPIKMIKAGDGCGCHHGHGPHGRPSDSLEALHNFLSCLSVVHRRTTPEHHIAAVQPPGSKLPCNHDSVRTWIHILCIYTLHT